MDTTLNLALTRIPAGTLLTLQGGRGQCIAVFEGTAWITQHHRSDDVVLGPGESYALDAPGLTIVQAMRDASVLLFEARAGRAAVTSLQPVSTETHPSRTDMDR